jgi:hypothetical protein
MGELQKFALHPTVVRPCLHQMMWGTPTVPDGAVPEHRQAVRSMMDCYYRYCRHPLFMGTVVVPGFRLKGRADTFRRRRFLAALLEDDSSDDGAAGAGHASEPAAGDAGEASDAAPARAGDVFRGWQARAMQAAESAFASVRGLHRRPGNMMRLGVLRGAADWVADAAAATAELHDPSSDAPPTATQHPLLQFLRSPRSFVAVPPVLARRMEAAILGLTERESALQRASNMVTLNIVIGLPLFPEVAHVGCGATHHGGDLADVAAATSAWLDAYARKPLSASEADADPLGPVLWEDAVSASGRITAPRAVQPTLDALRALASRPPAEVDDDARWDGDRGDSDSDSDGDGDDDADGDSAADRAPAAAEGDISRRGASGRLLADGGDLTDTGDTASVSSDDEDEGAGGAMTALGRPRRAAAHTAQQGIVRARKMLDAMAAEVKRGGARAGAGAAASDSDGAAGSAEGDVTDDSEEEAPRQVKRRGRGGGSDYGSDFTVRWAQVGGEGESGTGAVHVHAPHCRRATLTRMTTRTVSLTGAPSLPTETSCCPPATWSTRMAAAAAAAAGVVASAVLVVGVAARRQRPVASCGWSLLQGRQRLPSRPSRTPRPCVRCAARTAAPSPTSCCT